jgi:hypothetical protein
MKLQPPSKDIPFSQLLFVWVEEVHSKITTMGLKCSSVVQHLPIMREALDSIPAPKKKRQKKKKKTNNYEVYYSTDKNW